MKRPLIQISLDSPTSRFFPGDVLIAQYQIDVPDDNKVSAVESSIIWVTTGKGEEDFGVHFFERRPKQTLVAEQLRRPHKISSVLPSSPLSYDGEIIKIRWSVRLRVFVDDQQFTEDLCFSLGNTSTVEYQQLQ